MFRRLTTGSLLCLIFFCTVTSARAQTRDSSKVTYWINAQLGFGTYNINLAAEAGILLRSKHLFALKLDANANLFYNEKSRREATLFAALYGRKLTKGKYVYLTATTGAGMVFFQTRGNRIVTYPGDNYGPPIEFFKPGIPLEVKLWANPLPVIGITLAVGVNVTPHETFANMRLGLAIGKLRSIRI